MGFALRTTTRLRPLLTAVAALACLGVSPVGAGIGEARETLVGEGGPYGNPSGETTATLKDSRAQVDVFKRGKVTVAAEYDADGKVWKLTFHRKNMTDQSMTALLASIGGDRKWSKPVSYRGNKHWVSDDKGLHAVYYSTPLFKLVVMSDDAARAERLPQTLEGRETKRVAEDSADGDTSSEEGDPEKKADDPLKDFWAE